MLNKHFGKGTEAVGQTRTEQGKEAVFRKFC
ncbi:hypothetical protein LYNGBM3L_61890 [Moorena producens 3L]|uniref:Uncharacterized protein n=1 Tax=Moorena producens 3L TaxID=489825 RepID=F4Y0G7_9CYAN|nr:hypothetical protein LYNGBM3L_61890 [Moorena producens 3L]